MCRSSCTDAWGRPRFTGRWRLRMHSDFPEFLSLAVLSQPHGLSLYSARVYFTRGKPLLLGCSAIVSSLDYYCRLLQPSCLLQVSLREKPRSYFSFYKSYFTAFFSDSNSKLGLMHSHLTSLQQGSQPLFVVTSNYYHWFSLCSTHLALGGSADLYFSKFGRT